MTFPRTPGQDRGTPTPGANPNGYMLGPDEGSMTWFEKSLITFKAKSADTRGMVSFFQWDEPYAWQAPVRKHATHPTREPTCQRRET